MFEVLRHTFIIGAALFCGAAIADERPIFDAHIHYSHDAIKLVPPEQVAKILQANDIPVVSFLLSGTADSRKDSELNGP